MTDERVDWGGIEPDSEIARLREELARMTQERDELLKAVAHDCQIIEDNAAELAEAEATNANNLGLLEVIEQVGVERDRLAAELAEARAALEWPDGSTSAASVSDPPLPVETRLCLDEWRVLREAHAKTKAEYERIKGLEGLVDHYRIQAETFRATAVEQQALSIERRDRADRAEDILAEAEAAMPRYADPALGLSGNIKAMAERIEVLGRAEGILREFRAWATSEMARLPACCERFVFQAALATLDQLEAGHADDRR